MTPAERQQLLQRALRNAEKEREHLQRVPDGHPDPAEFIKRELWGGELSGDLSRDVALYS